MFFFRIINHSVDILCCTLKLNFYQLYEKYTKKTNHVPWRNDDFTRLNNFTKISSETDMEEKFNMPKTETYENFYSLDLHNDGEKVAIENAAENI